MTAFWGVCLILLGLALGVYAGLRAENGQEKHLGFFEVLAIVALCIMCAGAGLVLS